MDYTQVEEAGTLRIEYDGPQLDARAIGVLELQLALIAEKVAVETILQSPSATRYLYEHRYLVPPELRRKVRSAGFRYGHPLLDPYYRFRRPETSYGHSEIPIVRLRSDSLTSGSLYQDLSIYVAGLFASGDIRAVLQGFCSNYLFAFYHSGLRGITWIGDHFSPQVMGRRQASYDSFDIGPNLREVFKEMIANSNGEASKIVAKHKNANGEQQQIEIRIS